MPSRRWDARLRRLEARAQDDGPQGEGLSGLLRYLERHKDVDAVPVAALSDAESDPAELA